jgi:hypothetical protein
VGEVVFVEGKVLSAVGGVVFVEGKVLLTIENPFVGVCGWIASHLVRSLFITY